MRWVITGGCGFIGVNLIKNLIKEGGHHINVIDNLCLGKVKDVEDVCGLRDVNIIVDDIQDVKATERVCKGADVIVHLAALGGVRPSVEHPRQWFMNNTLGSFNVLEAAKNSDVGRVICASSSAAVGNCTSPVHELSATAPISPYGATKTTMESFCSAYYNSYGINTVCFRFSNVYGKYSHRKDQLIPKLLKRVLSGKEFNVYGDGEQTRDFIHVDDLVEAIKLCSVSNLGGEIIQLCSGKEHSVNTIVGKVKTYLEEYGVEVSGLNNVGPKAGDMRSNKALNTKIKSTLKWKPKTNIDDGIKGMVKWFIDRG